MHHMRTLMNKLTEEQSMGDDDRRFTAFVRDLEQISAKHGVVIQVVGNVYIQDTPLTMVRYSDDPTSGDIIPLQYQQQNMGAPRRWGYEVDADQVRREESEAARKARLYRRR